MPVNLPVYFTPDEIKVLRRLAATFSDQRGGAKFTLMAQECGMDRNAMCEFVMRLYPLRLAVGVTNETFRVLPLLVESLHAYDNKPQVDQWDRFQKWFFSRRWSVPVILLFVVPPLLVTWIGMLKTLLEWITAGK